MHSEFVPLHLHSQYSLLDGAIRIDDLLAAAAEFNMPAVAVTDHGNLFGAVDFFQKARKAGIKPSSRLRSLYISHNPFRQQVQRQQGSLLSP